MDTKTLVVGQDVYMISGCYIKQGKVVKVTPSGVVVQLALAEGPIRPEGNELIRFDTDGKACDSSDIYKGNLWGGSDPRIPGTHECGPWELDDIPFAERTALFEQASRDYEARKKLIANGVDVSRWEDWQAYVKTRKIPTRNGVGFVKRPERDRLADEIMKLLIKRQTSLAEGVDVLTTVKINVLKDNYEGARANEFNLLCADFYEDVRGFSESMKNDRFCLIPRKGFVEDAEHVVVKRDRVYFASVKRLWHRIGQALARGGTNLRNKLGQGGGPPERVRPLAIEIRELLSKRRTSRTTLGDALDALTTPMLTAIEATHGREKADEFDLLMARFSAEVRRFLGMQVQ